ncbi:MAG: A/G-specific adenine glycosylase [Candidatus Electrothrix sp. AR4]|nr:A/G-specific adenine glycosylase [Candidatus Electrothrix sp. AR4]
MDRAFFRSVLLDWFAEHQRPLPWRGNYEPYHVWISEIMGQQTQMDRVAVYFQNWISLFPDIFTLAAASEQEVLKAWEGLGYYSRVRNIRRTAKILVRDHGGVLPDDQAALLALPGIGPYTAAAVMSIAFNTPVPLLDANVERVLSRLEDIELPVKQAATQKMLLQLCEKLLPKDEARNFNQALMEFGALVCTPKNPQCPVCPIQQCCKAFAADIVDLRPVPGKKQEKINIFMACGIIQQADRFYIQQRMEEDVWGGLWEFPGGRLKEGETPERAAVREIEEETEFQVIDTEHFTSVVHYYTKYRVRLDAFFCTLREGCSATPVLHAASQFRWVCRAELDGFAFPSGHRQLIGKM